MIDFSSVSRRRALGRLLRAPLRLIPSRIALRVLQGPLRGARWIAGAGNHGYWLGSYEMEKQLRLAQYLSAGGVVYDIGANVGFYTLLAARLVGPGGLVVAFEPVPRNLALLRRHLEMNACTNVTVHAVAVAARSGKTRFSLGAGPSQGAIREDGDLEVEVVSIDELLAAGHLPPPSLLKIDVEGAELEVLRGAMKTIRIAAPVIFLATHGAEVHGRCTELLKTLGYGIHDVTEEAPDELLAIPATRAA